MKAYLGSIEEAEQHIARQIELIAWLKLDGQPTENAETVLRLMRQTCVLMGWYLKIVSARGHRDEPPRRTADELRFLSQLTASPRLRDFRHLNKPDSRAPRREHSERGNMHYLMVLVPQRGGGWCAYVPDFPGCRADGPDVAIAIVNVVHLAGGLIIQLRDKGMTMPEARSQQEIRTDDSWATDHKVDWSTAMISAVPIGEPD